MEGVLTNNFLMQNVAYWVKAGETKQTFFKFKDLDLKRSSYNQVAPNIISQRVDRIIETNWNFDFNIKDFVLINNEKYMIIDLPPSQRFNVLYKNETLQIVKLLQLAN